jgi:hypothetical protein
MQTQMTVDQIMHLARGLSPLEKLKLIEQLAPDLEPALMGAAQTASLEELDNQYQQAYEKTPEQISDVQAILPHLPLPTERWE